MKIIMFGEYEVELYSMSLLYDKNFLLQKGKTYCTTKGIDIIQKLGHGTQGVVYQTNRNSAIKIYDLFNGYSRERDIYKRLKERKIESVSNFKIPRIMDWNDELFILEMSIVHVPCVLDFGGAYLDKSPDHLIERNEEWESEKAEEFGENWEEAKIIIREIEQRAGIWLADINTGNIKFEGF
jgi:hypothetical protein